MIHIYMKQIDTSKLLKLIIIDPLGKTTFYYLDEKNSEQLSLKHYVFINQYIEECHDDKLKRKTKKASYYERLQWMEYLGYTILLDTTNYTNYHPGKTHSATILLSKQLTIFQQRVLVSFYPVLSTYQSPIETGYLLEKMPNNEFKNIQTYDQLITIIQKNLGVNTEINKVK